MRTLFPKATHVLIGWTASLVVMAQPAPDAQNIVRLERQVGLHLREQKPELAIPLLRQIVSFDPKNLNAQANLGVLLHFQGKHDEAIPHLRAASLLQPDLWRIRALLGIAEKRTGNLSRALVDLEQAFSHLDRDKTGIQVGLALIEIHGASAQFEKALAVAAKLGQLAPNDPQVLLATYQIARQAMDQALLNVMLAAPDSAESHMIMAGELAREGNQAKAVAEYRAAIRLNPSLPGVHFQLAELLRTSTDPVMNAQAEPEFQAALKVNPYDALSWRQLADIRNAKGEFKAAEEEYQKALALQPNDAEAKTGLAIVMISTNRADQALTLLESALKDDPTNITAHFRLSGLYRRAGRSSEAARELEAFRRYQELQSKLGDVIKSRRGSASRP